MQVYISSTFQDLKHHRQVLANALRKARFEVTLMEEYAARDELVEFACRGDVSKSTVYVGLFAWRLGYVPEESNPTRQSITEMEYEAAEHIPRLVFMTREDAHWPYPTDADRTRIEALRARLGRYCKATFSTEHELSTEVLAALRVVESTKKVEQLEVISIIRQLGPSYLPSLEEKLPALRASPLIEIQTGPVPWWNTRLHLIAALADEFGYSREFVFVDADRRFLAMASPREIKLRLAARWPSLSNAYAAFRAMAPDLDTVGAHLWRYPEAVQQTCGGEEQKIIQLVLPNDLQRSLGISQDAEVIDVTDKGQAFLVREIVGRTTPFVALVRDQRLEGLIDRTQLAVNIASAALA